MEAALLRQQRRGGGRATAGSFLRREWFGVVEAAPRELAGRGRYWDRAATEKRSDNDPDATVGLLLSKDAQGIYFIEDVRKMFASPNQVDRAMRSCAKQDGAGTDVGYMQDPGSAGVNEAQATARALDGFNVRFAPATGGKETRPKLLSAQAEAGNVKIVRAPWNDEFLRALENFLAGNHDDEVDAFSGAHETICRLFGGNGQWRIVDQDEDSEDPERDDPEYAPYDLESMAGRRSSERIGF